MKLKDKVAIITGTTKGIGVALATMGYRVIVVDADLGITFLPQMAEGSPLLKSTRIKTYPLSERSYREIGLVWRRGSMQGETFELLGKFLRDSR